MALATALSKSESSLHGREEQLAPSTSYFGSQNVLGWGQHGQTFIADLDGQLCAVKRLPALPRPLALQLATALASLQHPHINRFLGWGWSTHHAFLVSALSRCVLAAPPSSALWTQLCAACWLLLPAATWMHGSLAAFIELSVERRSCALPLYVLGVRHLASRVHCTFLTPGADYKAQIQWPTFSKGQPGTHSVDDTQSARQHGTAT